MIIRRTIQVSVVLVTLASVMTARLDAAVTAGDEQAADPVYTQARDFIDQGQFDRALERLNRMIAEKSSRTDAALYWKAYSLAKLGQRAEALTTLADLQKRFANSSWIRDAQALSVELRQASGQTVSPDAQSDDELKLMALRGLMQSDPDQALPIIERMLANANSTKVKDQALFVLSQSGSARARELVTNIAKGSNPDLQKRAIRYLGMMGGQENRQALADVYRGSSDMSVKREVIKSYMLSGDRARVLALAKSETSPELRREAVQQLGVMGGQAELAELYQSESTIEVKRQILQAMAVGGGVDKLLELAKSERDPELRRLAIRNLGITGGRSGNALKEIYQSDSDPQVKDAVVTALFIQNNGALLVELARAEKDPGMKKDIVQKLSLMPRSKEVTDYLMELLK